jgi:hypothetical protein
MLDCTMSKNRQKLVTLPVRCIWALASSGRGHAIASLMRAENPEWNLRWPYAAAVQARNGIAYLTARRFSAQDRPGAIRTIERLKAEAGDRETGLVASEIALLWLRLTGNPCGWTVYRHCTGHSGGGTAPPPGWRSPSPSGWALAHLQVWRDGRSGACHIRRSSAACRRWSGSPRPIGTALVVNDVATSGYHIRGSLDGFCARSALRRAGIAWR